ncbi:MAG TPA: hypothetical protein VM925_21370 [Labilithrix sp.]|nr:hypothetical protein [Labilithrix sp.]
MFWTPARLALVCLSVASGVLACSKQSPATAGTRGAEALDGVKCGSFRPPAEPELMAWDPASRAQLDKLRRQGVVAVRYEARGCDVSLELLPQCIGPKNRYVYTPASGTNTKIAHDTNELFAQLPLGATNVAGLLKERGALRTDSKLVGTVALPPGSTISEYDLVGPECKRATHVISAVYVGGFAMGAGDARQVNATNLFATTRPSEGMTREGHARICERAEAEGIELAGCSVPLRVALLSLDGHSQVATAKASSPVCAPGSAADGKRCASTEAGAGEPRTFDQSAVERVVRENQGAVKRKCWEATSDAVRRVNVAVTTTVDRKGRVVRADAQLVDSEGSADVGTAVARCIGGEIMNWQFPEPDAQKVLTLPFHLIRQ